MTNTLKDPTQYEWETYQQHGYACKCQICLDVNNYIDFVEEDPYEGEEYDDQAIDFSSR